MLTTTKTSTATRTDPQNGTSDAPPPLVFENFRKLPVALYIAFLLTCNVLFPCLLYYLLASFTKLTEKALIGIASSALGISSCFDSPFRIYRLIRFRKLYGPLNDDKWWHLDFFMWIYTIMLLTFAFPLAIAPAVPEFDFFLMATAILVGPLAPIFLLSLYPFKLLVWCSSDPPLTPIKPAVFYIVEDVGAVDFKHGRKWRAALHDRWHASPPFQTLMRRLTFYWALAVVLYMGLTAAVTWGAPLHFAFGWVLGQFFLWAALAALGCWWLTRRGLREESRWWEVNRRGEKGV